ncbi:MAG: hypothetical protein K8R58_12830 [Bacteroidales bacterium]|nr:hypothetical protein [Bacteroidales bacterium]
MSVNTNKIKEKEQEKEVKTSTKNSIAEKLLVFFLGGDFLKKENTLKFLPFILYLALLVIIYIGNSYYAEKNIREIEKIQKELKELRYEYISTKSELMHRSKQSQIAKSLKLTGIKESTVPPKKIFITEEEQEN